MSPNNSSARILEEKLERKENEIRELTQKISGLKWELELEERDLASQRDANCRKIAEIQSLENRNKEQEKALIELEIKNEQLEQTRQFFLNFITKLSRLLQTPKARQDALERLSDDPSGLGNKQLADRVLKSYREEKKRDDEI